jgi:hypothetical protein
MNKSAYLRIYSQYVINRRIISAGCTFKRSLYAPGYACKRQITFKKSLYSGFAGRRKYSTCQAAGFRRVHSQLEAWKGLQIGL